jgi:hypothetical protein
MALVTVFMVTVAIIFSSAAGSPATEFFGRNLYLVRGTAFDLIRAPSIVIGAKTDPAELGAGDIVIFTAENSNRKSIGEIVEATEESAENSTDEEIAVKQFSIRDESGAVHTVPEQGIISKAVQTSRAFGIIINFAASPAGLLVIAVIPCLSIILWEVLKPILRKIQDKKEVPTVNKQDEVPTFIPPNTDLEIETVSAEKIGEKSGKSAAALEAYKKTLKITSTQEIAETPELFTEAHKRAEKPKKKKPLSSVKLAEVIATVNSQQEQYDPADPLEKLSAAEKAARINQAMEAFKKTPNKE